MLCHLSFVSRTHSGDEFPSVNFVSIMPRTFLDYSDKISLDRHSVTVTCLASITCVDTQIARQVDRLDISVIPSVLARILRQ